MNNVVGSVKSRHRFRPQKAVRVGNDSDKNWPFDFQRFFRSISTFISAYGGAPSSAE